MCLKRIPHFQTTDIPCPSQAMWTHQIWCKAAPSAGMSWGGVGGRLHHWLIDVPQHLEKWASCISHGKSQTSLSLLICAPKGRIWLGSGGISEIKSLLRKQGFQQSWEIQR